MIAANWQTSLADADDSALSVYCDSLAESGSEHDTALETILREWLNTKTNIRTFMSVDAFKEQLTIKDSLDPLNILIQDFNWKYYPEVPSDYQETYRRHDQCFFNGRIGNIYTNVMITPEYLQKRPNLLSSNLLRSIEFIPSPAERATWFDVTTNWRLEKFWHVNIGYVSYWRNTQGNFIDFIRNMKPLMSCKSFTIHGIRDTNFKVSSGILGSKKLPKGCQVLIGSKRYVA